MSTGPLVCVVDDDESVRESLGALLRSSGLTIRLFASAEDYLNGMDPSVTHCAILDVTMPGMSGDDLQQHLIASGGCPPLVFVTALADSALHARLLERGAIACLVKPFREDEFFSAVRAAMSTVEPSDM